MIGTAALVLVVYVLAVARITRLINFDTIADGPRVRLVQLVRGNPTVVYFITCPWCVGMWVCLATAWVPMWHAANPVAQYVALALAASHVIGLLSPLSNDDELSTEPDDD